MHPYKYHLARSLATMWIFGFPTCMLLTILMDGYAHNAWRFVQLAGQILTFAAAGFLIALLVWWMDKRRLRQRLIEDATRPQGVIPRMLRVLVTIRGQKSPEIIVFRLMKSGLDGRIEYEADPIHGQVMDMTPIDTPPEGAVMHLTSQHGGHR